ncbi:MAG: PEP/pyruvate-binding domain-containing protein [Fluviicola sp.]
MRWLFLFTVMLLLNCSGNSQIISHQPTLKSQEQFDQWSSRPLYQKYGQVSSLKIVFDNQTEKLHFISSQEYEFHYQFCMTELGFPNNLSLFNDEAYSGRMDRRFLVANINYYKALDVFTLELGPSDRMNETHLRKLFNAVRKEVFFSEHFYLMLNTAHVNQLNLDKSAIPVIGPSEIYNGQRYQPISKYVSFGRIRVIQDWEKQKDSIRPEDIIIIHDIPQVFPVVQGVIVTQFQTPLSHVTLLGQNRRIPICAYTEIFSDEKVLDLHGAVVAFSVDQDTFDLQLAPDVDLSDIWDKGRSIRLSYNIKVDSLIPAELLREKHSNIVGCKAANFGELKKYSEEIDFSVPESAFAIPFYYYHRHIQKNGIQVKIDALLSKENRSRKSEDIRQELKEIRNLIKDTPLDETLLAEVENMIVHLGTYRRMRFRSSTNAEDREGFSGAGIYTSKTGELGNPEKPIDKAIKKVWASLWSYNAFMEREAFNIDHSTAAMGILVHRSFPDEEVNGVAITSNLYRDDYLGFVVNAQLGDESVVQPSGSIQCDEFICYPDESASVYGKQDSGIDIINYSSLNNGQLVMTVDEIQNLANVLELIKRKYARTHYTKQSYFNLALDLEFKLDRDTRQLYIKQMRIYNR